MPSGRARQFDVDEALDRAMGVFWRRGYEGATLPELTAAMGINRPSLYAAFGNKEQLFRKALDRYRAGPAVVRRRGAEGADRPAGGGGPVPRASSDSLGDPGNPRGCMMVQAALACGEAAEPIRKELAARREAAVAAIRRAVPSGPCARAISPRATDCDDLARYVATVMHGLTVQAAGGGDRGRVAARRGTGDAGVAGLSGGCGDPLLGSDVGPLL